MSPPSSKLVMPGLASSDFSAGNAAWGFLREAATLVTQCRPLQEIDFSGAVRLKPYAVALAIAVAKRLGRPGTQIIPPNDPAAKDRLLRLGVPAALGVQWGTEHPLPSAFPIGVFIDRPSPDFSYRTASLLAEEFAKGLPAGVTARIADGIDEVILNALAHSASPIGCVVVGQASRPDLSIEVAIVDLGVTIRGHLSRRFPQLATDEQAIQEAVKEGVTGTMPQGLNVLGDPNSGVGLSDLRCFVESTGGELTILSGTALVCFGAKSHAQMLGAQGFPGTLVNIRFNASPGTASPRLEEKVYY